MPIEKDRGRFGRRRVGVEGKRALSQFSLLEKRKWREQVLSLVEVRPKTGRTHQIRVHFSYMGWPLVGDKLYGGKSLPRQKRFFLHASYLSFPSLSKREERMEFSLALPADLQNLWDGLS